MSWRKPNGRGNRAWLATLATGGLTLVGVFLYGWQTQATPEFRGFGLAWSTMTTVAGAIVVVPISIVLALVCEWCKKRDRLPAWVHSHAILALGLLFLLCGVVAGFHDGTAKSRYKRLVGIADNRISEVRATGFNSFIARRWLLSFRVSGDDADLIASSLGLRRDDSIDLRKSLDRDVFFSKNAASFREAVPAPEGMRMYFRNDTPDQASNWISFAVDPANQRAWLYRGYQN